MGNGPMHLTVLDTLEEVAATAAARFVIQANTAIHEGGRFAVVLSGGSTPKITYDCGHDEFSRPGAVGCSAYLFRR